MAMISLISPAPRELSHQSSSCPAWIEDYVEWHREQRESTPQSARYLVFLVERQGGQGGLGDRVRAMLLATRLAIASRRVVLFSWEQPFELTEFLSPSLIDWRVNGSGYAHSSDPRFRWLVGQSWHPIDLVRTRPKDFVLNNGLLNQKARFVVISTNEYSDTKCRDCPDIDSSWSPAAICLFKSLFRFQDRIEALASQVMSSLGLNERGFVGLHLRLGGLIGETSLLEEDNPNKVKRGGTITRFLDGISCARHLSKDNRSAGLPVLVVVDNERVKAFIRAGNIPGFVTSELIPVHLDLSSSASIQDHYSTFAEVLLLSRSQCLVVSAGSGFSTVALLEQGGHCWRTLEEC